ncbi:MAG TPA: hypothetical protein PLV00_08185 [Caldisericia bacterium]|nr:hypothetical protein [Caldisericia bacterium]
MKRTLLMIILLITVFSLFANLSISFNSQKLNYEYININEVQVLRNKLNVSVDIKIVERMSQEQLQAILEREIEKFKSIEAHVIVRIYDYKTFPDSRKYHMSLWVALAQTNFYTDGLNANTDFLFHTTDKDYENIQYFYDYYKDK